ncbi:MAG: DUF1837 domain-containing protein [Lachnospiraceae bacterium]|nr:DUF1837 domain-containing protein [Lachnospiraceae bacterium]
MFKYKYIVPKSELNTTYGSICIENIIFEPIEIERALPDIVFNDENLKHMFAENDLSQMKRRNIYRRFAPKCEITTDMHKFVEENIRTNKSFYSFLAEGILGLVFRDIYDFNLAKGVIDICDTLADSHTGVDACMYNLQHNIIVLGEAKFYESLSEGINKIITDLVNKSIKNKLESLLTGVENCEEAYQIVIKNLEVEDYDELTVDQFMNQRIMFAGFVLHSEADVSKYGNQDFYDKYFISVQQLEKNVCASLNHNDINGDFEIILVHLPIKDKKSLILKMIETSNAKLRNM